MLYNGQERMDATVFPRNAMDNTDHTISPVTERLFPHTVRFSDCNLPQFMNIAANFGTATYAYAVTPNVDHLIRFSDDEAFRDSYRAAQFVLLDSRFLAYLLRVSAGLRLPTSPGSDVTQRLFEQVVRPEDKLVVVGASEEQARILAKKYAVPGLRHYNPPMGFINDPNEVEACLRFIEAESPFRFCLLAVGCPQQEFLAKALQNRGRARGLALCIGASINFLTGSERRAPRWMQLIGFEWLYRLMNDPRRLAKRYLVRGPRIFLLLPRLKFELDPVSPVASETARS
jgi:exopolysaccharide biosynthesis WecB/TagA/CpsF family protein